MTYCEKDGFPPFFDLNKEVRKFPGVMVVQVEPKSGNRTIVLGLKMRGIGQGKWQHTFTGKMEKGESEIETAIRETYEESGLRTKEEDLQLIGRFFYDFLDTAVANFIMEVPIYTANKFEGHIRDCDEIKPKLFNVNEIPLSEMFLDNKYWLPDLLKSPEWPPNKVTKGYFLYDNLDRISEYKLC